jgi:hypothetical protein
MNSLIEAYQNTKYKIFELALTIEIGKFNQEIDVLLQKNNSNEWSFITAYNPYSKVVSDEENNIRHDELKELTKSYKTFEGHGVGEDPTWEPEISLFIIGISKKDAIIIGNKYEQNAIVYGQTNQAPQLLILNQDLL